MTQTPHSPDESNDRPQDGGDAAPNFGPFSGLLGWMAKNEVAANILMFALLICGIFTLLTIKQEVYPSFELNIVNISVSYPGAAPEEVEEGILLPIEEQIRGIEAIDLMTATATQGVGRFTIELRESANPNRALQDIKNAVDRVSFFPEAAERPNVELAQRLSPVFNIALFGPLSEYQLFELVESARAELLAREGVTQVEVRGVRTPEIHIDIPSETLRSLGLTLDEVAQIVRQTASDVPAGGVRTSGGEILLRLNERREAADAYGDIAIVQSGAGSKVLLRDIATITEGFVDREGETLRNGMPTVVLEILQTQSEKPLEVAEVVRDYLETDLGPRLPPDVAWEIYRDRSESYKDRVSLLLRNGAFGLTLVLIVIALFLEPRLAMWVTVGIGATLIGAIALLPLFGASINMITLFAFIVTLGIVVDDAVIVGENIFHRMQSGRFKNRMEAAVYGVQEMTTPVLFAVATNIIAFLPLLFVPGSTGRFFSSLPAVIIAVFVVSLIEALFILPAHLGHTPSQRRREGGPDWVTRQQQKLGDALDRFIDTRFRPVLEAALASRYIFLAGVLAAIVLMAGWFESGRLKFTFFPQITSDYVDAEGSLPFGAPFSETQRVAKTVEAAGIRATERFGGKGVAYEASVARMGGDAQNEFNVGFILLPDNERDFTADDFVRAWRDELGEVPGVESIFFEYQIGPGGGAALTIEVAHPDRRVLEQAAGDIADYLRDVEGLSDIDDGFAAGKPQIDFVPTPEGRALGLTAQEIGRQARAAFFGAEALRLQRGRYETKVMVRLPDAERRTFATGEDLILRAPDGAEIPLSQAATLRPGRADVEIKRVDGRRVVNVTSNADNNVVNVGDVQGLIARDLFPRLKADYPGLDLGFEGRDRERRKALGRLGVGILIAGFAIFSLLAALFRSYSQALIVMTGIPAALAAAMFGHVVLGYHISVMSIFGMIALGGLVVNAGLVLNQEINRRLEEGLDMFDACVGAASRRFRPIVLTSFTTFVGLAPMIVERSTQAKFLIPMAISLGFGVLFSGITMLFVTPAMRLVGADLGERRKRLLSGGGDAEETPRQPAPAE